MCNEDSSCISYGWYSIRCAMKTPYVCHMVIYFQMCTEDSLCMSYGWHSIRCAVKTPYVCHMIGIVSDVE